MDYSQIDVDDLIKIGSCFSCTPINIPLVTKKHHASLFISDEVNQILDETTPLGNETKKSPMSMASPRESLGCYDYWTRHDHGPIYSSYW